MNSLVGQLGQLVHVRNPVVFYILIIFSKSGGLPMRVVVLIQVIWSLEL